MKHLVTRAYALQREISWRREARRVVPFGDVVLYGVILAGLVAMALGA